MLTGLALCSTHVASVLQMTHMLLCHGGLLKSNAFSGTLHLASYWAAVVHDFQHGGFNNDFLIKTADPIALLYVRTLYIECSQKQAMQPLLL